MEEPETKPFPMGVVLTAGAFILIGIAAFWVAGAKKKTQEKMAIVSALDKELGQAEEAVKTQRELVDALTRQTEELRVRISVGDVKDGKAAIAQFNTLAAQQRVEREKFIQMAEEYNQKVLKLHELRK